MYFRFEMMLRQKKKGYLRFFEFGSQHFSLEFPIEDIPVVAHMGDDKVHEVTGHVHGGRDAGRQFTYKVGQRDGSNFTNEKASPNPTFF